MFSSEVNHPVAHKSTGKLSILELTSTVTTEAIKQFKREKQHKSLGTALTTRCRDGVKLLWCHFYLVWLGSIPICACFIQKIFCDFITSITYTTVPKLHTNYKHCCRMFTVSLSQPIMYCMLIIIASQLSQLQLCIAM